MTNVFLSTLLEREPLPAAKGNLKAQEKPTMESARDEHTARAKGSGETKENRVKSF